MNGIYFDLKPDGLAVVATDGHKLVRNRVFSITNEVPASFILPKKPATLLKGFISKDSSDVVISFDARSAEISFGEGNLICRLIDGKYPNYNSVIPENNPYQIIIDANRSLVQFVVCYHCKRFFAIGSLPYCKRTIRLECWRYRLLYKCKRKYDLYLRRKSNEHRF